MEITFTRNVAYSLNLDSRTAVGRARLSDLAQSLEISVTHLKALVKDGDLYDEHGDALVAWIDDNASKAEVTEPGEIEIDQITL